jgi:hypothetical protein
VKTIQLTDRDVEVLKALWKWKMLTSAALWKGFFPDKDANTSYTRLWKLGAGGFIDRRLIDSLGRGFVWVLTKKGFHCIQDALPELKEVGYLSENITHDFYVSAVHAGDWLIHRPPQVELFSEQELRRIDPEMYADWVPFSEIHRPDGYWRVPVHGKLVAVALEVEHAQKAAIRYRFTAGFYQEHQQIFRAVWVVRDMALCNSIRKQIKAGFPDTLDLHDFILLEDFKKQGWNATFIHGVEKGRPLKDLLNGGFRHASSICRGSDLLDTRKAPGRSNTSAPSASVQILTDTSS